MPTRETPWPAGTPSWVDCGFDDLKKASDFYAKMFGWDLQEGSADMGHYSVALKNHHAAAGLAPRMNPDVPSMWCTFFATDDADATTQVIRDAGGTVLVEPMEVPGTGRMAFFSDPEGAPFGIWQGGQHIGFGIVNEPGAVGWNDLMTRDLDAAQTFYGTVFGFSYEAMGDTYAMCKRASDGEVVAGMHRAAHLPADAPASWLTHFVVADRDAAIATVEELGAEVLMSFDTPFGPEATVRGPEGEVFNVIAFTQEAKARRVQGREAV